MPERLSNTSAPLKQVRIQERAFTIGNITAINGYRVNRTLLKQRFAEGRYQVSETPHFLVCQRSEAPTTLLVHWFSPDDLDANIGYFFMQELKPLGLLTREHDFGDVFGTVVCSLFPHDVHRALHLYATNTLQQYDHLLTTGSRHALLHSPIDDFAAVYQRLCQLPLGKSFLDAGCSFGFLPLLIAERMPSLERVVGVDIQTDSFPVMRALAEERHLKQVQFLYADLLAQDVNVLGRFDTVVALHILEHFTELDMYQVLTHLLRITSKQLLIAVPFEGGSPESAYGHLQIFTRSKLEAVGQWCLEQIEDNGKMTYEDCAGGFLRIERTSP